MTHLSNKVKVGEIKNRGTCDKEHYSCCWGVGGREVKDLGLGWDLPDKLTIPF